MTNLNWSYNKMERFFSFMFFKVLFEKNNEGFAIDFCRVIKNQESYYHHIGLYIYTHYSLNKFIKLKQSKNELKFVVIKLSRKISLELAQNGNVSSNQMQMKIQMQSQYHTNM